MNNLNIQDFFMISDELALSINIENDGAIKNIIKVFDTSSPTPKIHGSEFFHSKAHEP